MNVALIRNLAVLVLIGLATPSLFAQQQLASENNVISDSNVLQLQKVIGLDLTNSSLEEAMHNIAGKTNLKLLYSKALLPEEKRITLQRKSISLYDALWVVLEGTDLRFAISQRQLILTKMPEEEKQTLETADIQDIITGQVTDSDSGEPLPGVNIVIQGTTTGTTTNNNGEFNLTVPNMNETLVFSYVGYQTQEVFIDGRLEINISMEYEVFGSDDLVVVAYGLQRRETATGAIGTVDMGDVMRSPVGSISNALVGRVPGLAATVPSGEPGQNHANLNIRGVSTLQSGGRNPLVVIDGIERDFDMLNSLDMNEISDVSILKDASATAVYGVRGANGVVIVTTKRGIAGAPQASFSTNFGFTSMHIPMRSVNSYDYATFRNEAVRNDNEPSLEHLIFGEEELWKFRNNRDYTPAEVEAMTHLTDEQRAQLLESRALYYGSTDWWNAQFGSPGPQRQYNANLSGGGEGVRYFTSVGYFSQDGNIDNANYGGADNNSTFDRYNFRMNSDIDAIRNTQISIDVGGQFSNFRGIIGQDGDVTSAFSRYKQMAVVLSDATPFSGPGIVDDKLVTNYVSGSSPLDGRGGGGSSPTSYLLSRGMMDNNQSSINTNAKISHDMNYLTQGLSVQGSVSYDNRYSKSMEEWRSLQTYTATRNFDNPNEILFFGGEMGPQSRSDRFRQSKWRRLYLESSVNYRGSFGNHNVTGLLLTNAQKTFDPGLRFNVPAGMMGIVSRVTYDYNERYLTEFNMGYNGSENFPPGNRFGFFPAVSAGWVISNENFFPETNFISLLKVRGSYGEVGNDQIGGRRYLYLPSTWSSGWDNPTRGYYFGETDGASKTPYYPGAWEAELGNPNVTWERAKKTNIGLEMNFFSDRLAFEGDYFYESRDNILWNLGTIPDLVAANLPPGNIGEVSNRGFELQSTWRDRVGEVGYVVRGNMSYARNRVEFMDEPANPYEWMNQTGMQLGQYRGYSNEGFFNSASEANNRPYIAVDGNRVQAGDLRYVDINGDGVINAHDQVPIGHANLPQYNFNFNLGFSFRGFDLSALLTGTARASLPLADFGAFDDSPLASPFGRSGTGGALQWHYDERWTSEKIEQGIEPGFPRASTRTPFNVNAVGSSFWIQSSNYLRLKNMEISYTFYEVLGIRNVRLYVNGTNLYTFGDYIVDPEQQHAGGATRGFLYPLTSTYNFGVNFQF